MFVGSSKKLSGGSLYSCYLQCYSMICVVDARADAREGPRRETFFTFPQSLAMRHFTLTKPTTPI